MNARKPGVEKFIGVELLPGKQNTLLLTQLTPLPAHSISQSSGRSNLFKTHGLGITFLRSNVPLIYCITFKPL